MTSNNCYPLPIPVSPEGLAGFLHCFFPLFIKVYLDIVFFLYWIQLHCLKSFLALNDILCKPVYKELCLYPIESCKY